MTQGHTHLSTGLPGLDRMLRGLIPGDNIVWQVGSVDDYVPFVRPYCAWAAAAQRKLVYFRFAKHPPLVAPGTGAGICSLDPQAGFETFLGEIHAVINRAGRGACYVFDCLSDLSVDWYSDQMLGCFFMLTCPYLFDLETVTYFALLRDHHSVQATEPIIETTQLFLDAFRHKGRLYVHPIKVQQRFSSTMYMLHEWAGDAFVPVTQSAANAEILASGCRFPLDPARQRLGVWARTLPHAEAVVENMRRGDYDAREADELFQKLLRMAVSRDERVLQLARRYLDLEDVVAIFQRMIGTGLIGGKSVGMLLARAILRRTDPRWTDRLEAHDSFYIASDVFYTFLVLNGCWWIRQELRDPDRFLENAEKARRRIFSGRFPPHIEQQLANALDYFGQAPFIVRSSSLLEDNFGNAFAGKYESVFCVNQGSRERRLQDFISAVKTVYASTMSERALTYRARRGLLDRDEQMALLVQRVSGDVHGRFFFPDLAGVGYSFNPYVWSEDIDPAAGVLRLVFGLGTRAVDRSDDDYTRLVALNAPTRRPEGESENARRYIQRRVDVLDLEGNQLVSADVPTASAAASKVPMDLFASRDSALERELRRQGTPHAPQWMLTFDKLLSETRFGDNMHDLLRLLQEAYQCPVDVEFTVNFVDERQFKINVLQCRPFQVQGSSAVVNPPVVIQPQNLVLQIAGPVIGRTRVERIDWVVYVVPFAYAELPVNQRYGVARCIGRVMQTLAKLPAETVMLIGPGRWGTTTPSLGVPVSFAEISSVSILCEVVAMRDDLVPDVSLGTHFFGELVETDVLYLALFPKKKGNHLNTDLLERLPNRLAEILPDAAGLSDVLRVIELSHIQRDKVLRLYADALKQAAVCYFDLVDMD